jgi:hypothetical protein
MPWKSKQMATTDEKLDRIIEQNDKILEVLKQLNKIVVLMAADLSKDSEPYPTTEGDYEVIDERIDKLVQQGIITKDIE